MASFYNSFPSGSVFLYFSQTLCILAGTLKQGYRYWEIETNFLNVIFGFLTHFALLSISIPNFLPFVTQRKWERNLMKTKMTRTKILPYWPMNLTLLPYLTPDWVWRLFCSSCAQQSGTDITPSTALYLWFIFYK